MQPIQQKSTTLLVDINSYFATLLQQENPHLRGKPVAVVKDLGRTCVIAASKEAKKMGIKTGSNIVEARQAAPNLIEMKAEFDRYLDATKRLKRLFESISPEVIVYSLDEAFIDISHCQQYLYSDPHQLGRQIQRQIQFELGEWVTSNVGIGPNRFLAKMAAEIAPKGAVFEINQDNLDSVLASVEFQDVCGIGLRLGSKLKSLNINHPYQIRFYSVADLKPLFGPFWSRELIKMAYGLEPHHLQLLDRELNQSQTTDGKTADRSQLFAKSPNSKLSLKKNPMKTVSRSITLWELVDDEQEIKQVLYNLTWEVVYKARRMNLAGRRVGVGLWGSDYLTPLSWHNHQTLKTHVNHTSEMFKIIWDQLYQSWERQFKPIKFMVSLGLLESSRCLTSSLLPDWQKQERVETALDAISRKYGLFTVRSGLLLDREIIRPEVTGFLGDKQYQLEE